MDFQSRIYYEYNKGTFFYYIPKNIPFSKDKLMKIKNSGSSQAHITVVIFTSALDC